MKIVMRYLITLVFLSGFFACEDMNSIHKEYLNRGEDIYIGVIDSLSAFPGNERVKFTWELNADPRITKTVIFWNNNADSATVEVNRTQADTMKMETILALPEGSHIFRFITKDDEGHKSLSVEKAVDIYGSRYVSTLQNREIKSLIVLGRDGVQLILGEIETRMLYTKIIYIDHTNPSNPKKTEIVIENGVSQYELSNVKTGDEIIVNSVYQPVGSLDLFIANATVYHVPASE